MRVFDWLDHLGVPAHVHDYLGASSNSPRQLVRRPTALVRAEYRLRHPSPTTNCELPTLVARQASPLSNGRIEAELLGRSKWGVYDFDDALYLQNGGPFPKSRIWESSVRSADLVIAGNTSLAESALKYNRNVTIIPSCVDPEKYKVKSTYTAGDPPRAVWIGSPTTEKYLVTIQDALLEVHRRTGLRLTVISGGQRPIGRLGPMVDRIDWAPSTFASLLTAADFGIMPLDDTPWSRGKCAYKLLQYGAAGLPLIGSPVGVNADILALAEGLAPNTVADWGDALTTLVQEHESERAARGHRARTIVAESFSFQAWAGHWRAAVGI